MDTGSLIARGEGRSGLADIWARLTLRRGAWWRAPNSPATGIFLEQCDPGHIAQATPVISYFRAFITRRR